MTGTNVTKKNVTDPLTTEMLTTEEQIRNCRLARKLYLNKGII
jgi:hypothetical protein